MSYSLLDLRGLILHALHSGSDPDARLIDGKLINSPAHCVINFLDRHLLPITEFHRLNHIIAVRDAGNEYRKAIYPDYKAHRKTTSPAMQDAVNQAQQAVGRLLDGLGIPSVWVPGVEADDVIAHLCQSLSASETLVTVNTRDADLIQLVNDTTLVIQCDEIKKGIETSDLTVLPRHIALYKSLCGDSSDGYKGIPGFGPARFQKLIELYGLDGLDELDQAVRDMDFKPVRDASDTQPALQFLLDHKEAWRQSYLLAQLHPELCNRLVWRKRLPSAEKIKRLFAALHIEEMWPKVEIFLPYRILVDRSNWPAIKADVQQALSESTIVGFDIETTDQLQHPPFQAAATGSYVDMLSSTVTGAGFTLGRNLDATLYLTFAHAGSNNLPLTALTELLASIQQPVVIHNMMFERTVIKNSLGFDLANQTCHDTKIMASHVDENEPHGLKDLSKAWFNYDQTHYKDVIEPGKTMEDYSAEHVFQYGADDPWVTAHLHDLFQLILLIEGTWEFCRDNEFTAVYPISDGHIAGVTVDYPAMAELAEQDQATYAQNISQLQHLLATEVDATQAKKGSEILYREACRDIDAAVLIGKTSLEEATSKKELAKLECRTAAQYTPLSRSKKLPKAAFTAVSLSKVASVLGCPDVNKVTKKELAAYTAGVNWFQDGVRAGASPEFLARCADTLWSAKPEWETSGDELNLNSPKQMYHLLYGKLALPIRLRNFTVPDSRKSIGLTDGSPATDKDALASALAEDCFDGDWRREALLAIQSAKLCMTRQSMFYSKYPLWQHPKTGNIHPNINSTGTETRRPSGSNPNPLQWPKRGDGVKFRRCILPNKNLNHDLIVSLDWSSQELRVLAGLSLDKEMLKVYGPGGDSTISLHTAVGAAIAGVSYTTFRTIMEDKEHPLAKKYKDLRNKGKAINFGGAYGIGPTKLARQLMVPVDQAKDYLEAKKALYHGVEEWRERMKLKLHRQGYLSNLFGSRRHLFNQINSQDQDLVGHYERAGINALIQGLCADLLKRTLALAFERRVFQRYEAVLVAPIYDEVAMSCHHSQAVGLILEMYDLMTLEVPCLGLSLPAAPSVGINFGDQIEVMAEEDIGRAPTSAEIQKAINLALFAEQTTKVA